MSLEIDVSCFCDGCQDSLHDTDSIYCERCFNGESDGQAEPEEAMTHCACGAYVPRRLMIEKVPGLKCRKCAKKYEAELLAASAEATA